MTSSSSIPRKAPAVENKNLRMSYNIGRGEQGVLSFEPYKSLLLPFWRFKTPDMARKSSQDLWTCFETYDECDDFVGMDMTRKFIQMGMTRAKRYANHKGGRKYDSKSGKELQKSTGHRDMLAKKEASDIFRSVWLQCRNHKRYQERRKEFLQEQRKHQQDLKG